MDPLRYQQAKKLFLDVCDLEPEEREGPLTQAAENDPELRSNVESLLAEHDRSGSPDFAGKQTVAAPAKATPESRRPTMPSQHGDSGSAAGGRSRGTGGRRSESSREQPEQIGPYRIIHELGRGGMGLVYLGERQTDQFRRRVAIKVLKKGMDTDDILRRFKLEEELLGSLNHPGIARLYDAGETDFGLPFFAMEFIEGSDIEQYCDAHRLSVRERLVLFKKVCEAVHYAHQNLVVHRDLKPSNIIVTTDGQPKLLDFGIAKLLNPELGAMGGDPTAPEFRVMTPEYASPEQVRGNPITTSSDIYSLGVMLYELLSGHAPYQLSSRARPELERVICEQDPERPSTAISKVVESHWVNPTTGSSKITPDSVSHSRESRPDRLRRSLAGDVDNIVLMAMRKEPQRRYASAEQMAEDIQRHLDGMPVIARADTFGYRAAKFVGRNRAGVAAATLMAVLLVGGITGTTSGWRAAEDRRAEIAEAWAVASDERDRAELNLKQVVSMSAEMLVPLHEKIETLDGSLPARRELIEIAMGYLETLEEQAEDREDLHIELARAHHRIGDVFGGLRNPSEGAIDPALDHFNISLRMREALLAAEPDDVERQRMVAASLLSIGDVRRRRGDTAGAVETYERRLALTREYFDTNPDEPEFRRDLAVALGSVGDGHYYTGNKEGALEYWEQSLPIRKKLMAEEPDNTRFMRDTSTMTNRIASILHDRGDAEAALVKYQDSVRIRQQLTDREPDNSRFRRDHAVARYFEGLVLTDLERYDDAAEALEHFRAVAAQRSAIAPRNARAASDLAEAHHALGSLAFARCDMDTALEHFDTFFTTIAPISEADPNNTRYLTMLGHGHQRLGEVLAHRGEYDGAIDRGREALAIMDRLTARDESDVRSRENLAEVNLMLGRCLTSAGEGGEAVSRLRDAMTHYRALRAQMPREHSVRVGLARTLVAYADALIERDEIDDAFDAADEAVTLLPDGPDRPDALRALASAHDHRGEASTAADLIGEAQTLLDDGPHGECDSLRARLDDMLRSR